MNTSSAQKHAEKIAKLALILPELEDLPGRHISLICADLSISVNNWADFRAIRHYFDGRVKPIKRTVQGSDGSYWFYYALDGDDLRLCINVDPVTEGATCRREKVGEDVRSIYRIVCD